MFYCVLPHPRICSSFEYPKTSFLVGHLEKNGKKPSSSLVISGRYPDGATSVVYFTDAAILDRYPDRCCISTRLDKSPSFLYADKGFYCVRNVFLDLSVFTEMP